MDINIQNPEFEKLISLFEQTQYDLQKHAARSIDIALVVRNWLFGLYIVEYENGQATRTELYGKKLFNQLSTTLKFKGFKGISPTNLRKFREFYTSYSEIQQTVSVTSCLSGPTKQLWPAMVANLAQYFKLGWSHYVITSKIRTIIEKSYKELSLVNFGMANGVCKTFSASNYNSDAPTSSSPAKGRWPKDGGVLTAVYERVYELSAIFISAHFNPLPLRVLPLGRGRALIT